MICKLNQKNTLIIWESGIIIHIFCSWRQKNHFDYLAIAEDRSLSHKWNEEKRMQKIAERGNFKPSSFAALSFYVKKKPDIFCLTFLHLCISKMDGPKVWHRKNLITIHKNGIVRILGDPFK